MMINRWEIGGQTWSTRWNLSRLDAGYPIDLEGIPLLAHVIWTRILIQHWLAPSCKQRLTEWVTRNVQLWRLVKTQDVWHAVPVNCRHLAGEWEGRRCHNLSQLLRLHLVRVNYGIRDPPLNVWEDHLLLIVNYWSLRRAVARRLHDHSIICKLRLHKSSNLRRHLHSAVVEVIDNISVFVIGTVWCYTHLLLAFS